MIRARIGMVLLCCATAAPLSASAQDTSSPGKDDPVITIDGAKNPELIPNWAAWQEAFHFMAAPEGPGGVPIPTILFPVTTDAQRALIRKEALAVVAAETLVYADATKLLDGLTEANRAERSERAHALDMKIRQTALDARDRLLPALSPAGQGALREFAESMRRGYKVTLLKSKLAQYRLPE